MSEIGFWTQMDLMVKGTDGPLVVKGWSFTTKLGLSVTPEVRRDGKPSELFVITHNHTGMRLWPDAWPLDRAKSLCLELLQLHGWFFPHALENVRLVDAATAIAKRGYIVDGKPA